MVKVTLGDGSGKVGPARAVPWVGTLVVVPLYVISWSSAKQRSRSGSACRGVV